MCKKALSKKQFHPGFLKSHNGQQATLRLVKCKKQSLFWLLCFTRNNYVYCVVQFQNYLETSNVLISNLNIFSDAILVLLRLWCYVRSSIVPSNTPMATIFHISLEFTSHLGATWRILCSSEIIIIDGYRQDKRRF